ncbi:chlorite dismutase [Kytococcus aerolatus]|uniref:Coproheme decarboxylase n=1 Tax=Kytococcus aerolatus TaxID=592308 RepID=A0A212T3R0_9MICO|nr:hydrogen peroxide-dependent heme synthase [Kytococcus aerolatus]SNC60471.1 chlorite dismutase [Kytococcus aerolatus]
MSDRDRVSPAKVREINESLRYTMWSVFEVPTVLPADRIELIAHEAESYLESLAEQGVEVRGVYDLAGMRAGADYLIWWHAESNDQLQEAFKGFRRTELGARSRPTWSVSALHRPAEFNKSHVPAFLAGGRVRDYLCLYPFVRTPEWYLMDPEKRRQMLVEHGVAARDYKEVRANTIPAFGLGDYEWALAFESDDLSQIVDLMRTMRETEARRYVKEEVPFHTGKRTPVGELVRSLPHHPAV